MRSKKTFLTHETLIITLTFKKKQTHQRPAPVPFPLLSPTHLFCSRVTKAVAAPGNLLKVLRCSHNSGRAFLKCPRSLIGNQRHAARERLQESLKSIPFIFTHYNSHSLDSSLAEQNPITKQCTLLLKKCFKTPGMVKLLTLLQLAADLETCWLRRPCSSRVWWPGPQAALCSQ